MFESIKLRIMSGRKLKPFATAKVLQEHEDKIKALEKGIDPDGVSIDDLKDAEVVEAVITYEGGTTATAYLVTQAVNDNTQQEPEGP